VRGDRFQTLLGVTGSGKTFTMANVVANVQRPTLVIAHNKTLAAQLYGEFKELFPENAVEYFVSYYDYYQPEAYVPSSDTYIEKDSTINDEIERMRHSATHSLRTRNDVLIVASVSCIYGLGTARLPPRHLPRARRRGGDLATTTTTSRRRTSRRRTRTSRRTRPSTTRSSGCATRPRTRCARATTC
jgi:hypothetical protein